VIMRRWGRVVSETSGAMYRGNSRGRQGGSGARGHGFEGFRLTLSGADDCRSGVDDWRLRVPLLPFFTRDRRQGRGALVPMNRSLPFSPRYTRQRVHGVRLSACQSPPVISLRLPLGTSALMDAVWMRGGKHFSVPSEGNQTVILELIRHVLDTRVCDSELSVVNHAMRLDITRRLQSDGPRHTEHACAERDRPNFRCPP
jgi:hypothetical protein